MSPSGESSVLITPAWKISNHLITLRSTVEARASCIEAYMEGLQEMAPWVMLLMPEWPSLYYPKRITNIMNS